MKTDWTISEPRCSESERQGGQVAAYIAELAGELAVLARRHDLDVLAYLLHMTKLEAESATRHVNDHR